MARKQFPIQGGNVNSRTSTFPIAAVAFTVLLAASASGQGEQKKPAPEMERLSKMFVGSWRTSEKHEPGKIAPKGGTGNGSDTTRLGPGGMSLIYDYKSSDPTGKFAAHGILWWDPQDRGYRAVECQNRSETGCEIGAWHWNGNDLVSEEEGVKEAWTNITPTSRTFYMEASTDSGQMKRVTTIEYTRVEGSNAAENKKP